MNCDVVQHRLLTSETPDPPSADVSRHLAECPSCRVWQRRLAQLEQQLPQLATPPSERKADVVRLILDGPLNGAGPNAVRLPFVTPKRDRGLLKVSVAIALAAALVLFAVGIGLWQLSSKPAPKADPLAARRLERDRRLAASPTTRARVETVAKFADEVHEEALALARQGETDKLATVSTFYIELVQDNLLGDAQRLPSELRREVLVDIAEQLQRTESDILGLLANDVKPANKPALQEMAAAARTSHDQLLKILRSEA